MRSVPLSGHSRSRGTALAAVREGHDLHYGSDSSEHALLDGDRRYADGLAELAAAGDLEGVRVLADLISTCARAHAEGEPVRAADAWRKAEADLR